MWTNAAWLLVQIMLTEFNMPFCWSLLLI